MIPCEQCSTPHVWLRRPCQTCKPCPRYNTVAVCCFVRCMFCAEMKHWLYRLGIGSTPIAHVPTSHPTLGAVQTLYMNVNQLTSTLPSSWSTLTNLNLLLLRQNQLTGGVGNRGAGSMLSSPFP